MNILEARKKSSVIRRASWEKGLCVDTEKDTQMMVTDQLFTDDWEPVYPDAVDFVTACKRWTMMRNVESDCVLTFVGGLARPRGPTWYEVTSLWVEHKE